MLYTLNKKHSWWGALSRSVRTPSRGELDGSVLADVIPTQTLPIAARVITSPGLGNEVGTSLEAGYRGQLRARVVVDGAFFASRMQALLTPGTGNPQPQLSGPIPYILLPIAYRNQSDANSEGIELAVRTKVSSRLEWSGVLTWLHFSKFLSPQNSLLGARDMLAASPGWQFYFNSQWNPARRWECDATYFWYGPSLTGPQTTQVYGPGLDLLGVMGAQRQMLDIRLGRRIGEGIDLSAGAQALTIGNRFEYKAAVGPVLAPIRPSAYARITFRF